MDINYLLFLQDFRGNINDLLTPFMEGISHFAVTYLMLVPTLIYWCLDKKKGLYTICSYCITITVNAIVKLTACIYRPWIRDPRVIPAGDAITESTGYSFPSGHTATATPMYAGIGITFWKKTKSVAVICILLIALTGFSRNYLGVHTPQDVFVAIVISIATLIGVHKLFQYLEKNPDKEDMFLLIGVIFCIAALFYISYKGYPMDYVDGKLMVDPKKMMVDGYGDIGKLLAFCLGRYVEKHFIGFVPAGLSTKGIIVSVAGIIPLFLIYKVLPGIFASLMGAHFGKLFAHAVLIFFVIAAWPAVIKMIMKKQDLKTANA